MIGVLQGYFRWPGGRVVRSRYFFAAVLAGAFGFFAAPASAQVSFYYFDPVGGVGDFHAICDFVGQVVLTNDTDCDAPVDLQVQPTGFYVGPRNSQVTLDAATGNATFGASATFVGGAEFQSPVVLRSSLQAGQVFTTGIQNSGTLSTAGINNSGSLLQTGTATFNGSVTMDGFNANSGRIGTLNAAFATVSSLTVTPGGQLNMSGNRIQNVGAPIADTDAANKAYVDNAVSSVQGNVAALSTTVADHETRITAVENTNNVQDNRITAVENANGVQDTRLNAVETENVTQNTRLTSVENVNIAQDSRMTAIEAVNTIQSNQISTLQDQVGGLQNSVTGLRRNIREANGGIAAAVALGGTMVVPESNVSLSFNLATYRGEQGFSGAVVGRVAPKIYVNAGVGGSTVRKSTAGRVGISFGL